jgi:hypothetical protein
MYALTHPDPWYKVAWLRFIGFIKGKKYLTPFEKNIKSVSDEIDKEIIDSLISIILKESIPLNEFGFYGS